MHDAGMCQMECKSQDRVPGVGFPAHILLTNLIPISDVLLPLCILTRLETQLVGFRPLISLVTVRSIGFPDRCAQNITEGFRVHKSISALDRRYRLPRGHELIHLVGYLFLLVVGGV